MCDDVESVQSSDLPLLNTSTLYSSPEESLNSSNPKHTLTSRKNTSIKELKLNLKEVMCEKDLVSKELREEREKFEKEMSKMMDEKEKFKREKREMLENLVSCLKERDSLKEDIVTLKSKSNTRTSVCELLQGRVVDLSLECSKVENLNNELNEKLRTCESEHLGSSTEHEMNKSRISTLERELTESTKCNDVLTAKLMKSENEYLRILKDLEHSNSRVHKLEQDLKALIKNPLK